MARCARFQYICVLNTVRTLISKLIFNGVKMAYSLSQLLLSLVIILIASEIFTNALEHFSNKLRISDGITGSLFAAVGTALPETVVPLIAIFSGSSITSQNEEIGVGSILGAPLMLSTLSVFLMSMAVVRKRGLHGVICPEPIGYQRDTTFFLIAFIFASLTMFIPHENQLVRQVISGGLILLYFIYVIFTVSASRKITADGGVTEAGNRLFFTRIGLPNNMVVVLLQVITGVTVLIGGAFIFIDGVTDASKMLGVSALLLSLTVIPIATELPEKINSILWIRRGKDTLALGNITGAMVFQGTILPAVGILLTPWDPRKEVLTGVTITLVAATWLWICSWRKEIRISDFLINGALYATYIWLALKP